MTEKGQAGDFFVQDFADLIEQYVGRGQIDYVLYNRRRPSTKLLERYQQERERKAVVVDPKRMETSYRMIGANLVASRGAEAVASDSLAAERTLIRHDTKQLGKALLALLYLQEAELYLR